MPSSFNTSSSGFIVFFLIADSPAISLSFEAPFATAEIFLPDLDFFEIVVGEPSTSAAFLLGPSITSADSKNFLGFFTVVDDSLLFSLALELFSTALVERVLEEVFFFVDLVSLAAV